MVLYIQGMQYYLTVVFLYYVCSVHVRAISTSDFESRINCTSRISDEEWAAENFPNPVIDVDYCGRNSTPSRICDPEHVLTYKEGDQLDRVIAEETSGFNLSSSCNVSTQSYYTAILQSVGNTSLVINVSDVYTTGSAFMYTLRQHKWRFCDDDIVILISKNDNMLWISVGEAIQNITTPECVGRLEEEFASRLWRGYYIRTTLIRLIKRLRDILREGTCVPPKPVIEGIPTEALIAGIGVFVILLVHGAYMIRMDIMRKKRALEPHKPKKKKKNYTLIVRRPSRASLNMARRNSYLNEKKLSRRTSQENKALISSQSEGKLSRQSSREDKTLTTSQSERMFSRQSSQETKFYLCEEKLPVHFEAANDMKNKTNEIEGTDVRFVLVHESDTGNVLVHETDTGNEDNEEIFEMTTVS